QRRRLVAVGCRGDLEALLGQRVADRVADRRLVVGDEDSAAAHATGVGLGFATGRRTQKVLPSPCTDSTPIRPPITSTIRCAIAKPRPKPSCLRVSLRR